MIPLPGVLWGKVTLKLVLVLVNLSLLIACYLQYSTLVYSTRTLMRSRTSCLQLIKTIASGMENAMNSVIFRLSNSRNKGF